MNTFRFMGRHPDTQLWISGEAVKIIKARYTWGKDRAYVINHGYYTEVEIDTVCQSTGFVDSTNEEIFDKFVLLAEDGKTFYTVCRKRDGSCVLVNKQDQSQHCLGKFLQRWKIVGHKQELAEQAV